MSKLDRETILDAVHNLPVDDQLEIARQILAWTDTAEVAQLTRAMKHLSAMSSWIQAMPAAAQSTGSVAGLRGIASMETPPDDATVDQWIDEHRMEKYGR